MTTNKPEVKRFNMLTYQGAIQSQGAMCVLASDYDALQAECEKLRKDAERYRWLREQRWSTGDMAVLTSPKSDAKMGAWLPSGRLLDIAIDAAMQEDA